MLLVSLVVLYILIAYLFVWHERRLWGKGFCSCGGYWKSFYRDAVGGGRAYRCNKCHTRIFLSWINQF